MTCGRSLSVSGMQEGIFLRKTSLGDKSGSRGWWSGGDARGERDGR